MKKKKNAIRTKKAWTREEALAQAHRYFDNAQVTLKKSPVQYGIYSDEKYVAEACAMAYIAALKAIDSVLLKKGTHPDELPESIFEYRDVVMSMPHNGKLWSQFKVVYQNLHIMGYYRGGVGVKMIGEGFENAEKIIGKFS